jgi:Na+/melibiose symporter-like transporter
LLDALIDPLLGRWSDHLYARSSVLVLYWAGLASVALGLGFALLFFPPVHTLPWLLVWALACLVLTYTAFSALSILHQSWGALLGGDEAQRARIVAWREGLGLLGVVLASVTPLVLGLGQNTLLFFLTLTAGWMAWRTARTPLHACFATTASERPAHKAGSRRAAVSLWLPFSRPTFRALLSVFVVNGIASAVPATLILFFVQDRLQAPAQMQAFFLGSYFVSAALSIPFWLKLVSKIGLARTWGLGMVLAVCVFAFAAQLASGDSTAFLLVCALSGVALGTDLALPAALLAGTLAANGDQGLAEGAYFGWWNFATKLNLALAAGVALPLLSWLGYAPGAHDAAALQTLTNAYCLLPCALKLLAATLLYTLIIRRTP